MLIRSARRWMGKSPLLSNPTDPLFRFEALVQKQPLASLSPWLPSISDLGALELFIVGSYWAALVAFIVLRLDGRTDAISAAKAVGDLAAFQYGVTLLPVTRNSVWLVAMRLPFERAVRWHIWNSCGVLVSVFSHGVLFMVANRANGTVSAPPHSFSSPCVWRSASTAS